VDEFKPAGFLLRNLAPAEGREAAGVLADRVSLDCLATCSIAGCNWCERRSLIHHQGPDAAVAERPPRRRPASHCPAWRLGMAWPSPGRVCRAVMGGGIGVMAAGARGPCVECHFACMMHVVVGGSALMP